MTVPFGPPPVTDDVRAELRSAAAFTQFLGDHGCGALLLRVADAEEPGDEVLSARTAVETVLEVARAAPQEVFDQIVTWRNRTRWALIRASRYGRWL